MLSKFEAAMLIGAIIVGLGLLVIILVVIMDKLMAKAIKEYQPDGKERW